MCRVIVRHLVYSRRSAESRCHFDGDPLTNRRLIGLNRGIQRTYRRQRRQRARTEDNAVYKNGIPFLPILCVNISAEFEPTCSVDQFVVSELIKLGLTM